MGRSKKPKKSQKSAADLPKSIRFELEADAEDLLRAHLDQFKPDRKDDENPTKRGRVPGRRSGKPEQVTMDLHGYSLDEAKERIELELDALVSQGRRVEIKLITGKGRHSSNREGVLAREVHGFVLRRYREQIESIESSPDDVRLEGLPIRGHFHVTLQGKRSQRKR